MDPSSFDRITKGLAEGRSRRLVVKALVGGAGGLLALVGRGAGASKGNGGGTPQGRCPTGYTNCRGTCVDITDNPNHCGACNLQCSPGETCRQGACTACENPAQACGDRLCGSVTTNCGSVACTGCTDGGGTCLENGTCVATCFAASDCPAGCDCPGHFPAQVGVCASGTCTGQPSCADDGDCDPGYFCADCGTGEGRCLPTCPS